MAFRTKMLWLLEALFLSVAHAGKYAGLIAQETAYSPGQILRPSTIAPRPTSPPQALRQVLKRDQATCGYYRDNGEANVCGESQYCTTTASGGGYGVWNCCNPTDCFLATTCIDLSECSDYCITSYMSADNTWFSRFMCGGTASGSTVVLVYSYKDTYQYTDSIEAAAAESSSSEAAAAAASASAAAAASQSGAEAASAAAQSQADEQASQAAQSAADASSRSSESAAAEASAQSSAQAASESAAEASKEDAAVKSSLSAAAASISRAAKSPFSTKVTLTQLITNSQGSTETILTVVPTQAISTTGVNPEKKDSGLSKGATAGVAVAAVVGALLVAAGVFILYRMWKKKREDSEDDDVPYITGTQVAEKKSAPTFYSPPSQSGTLVPSNHQGSNVGSWR